MEGHGGCGIGAWYAPDECRPADTAVRVRLRTATFSSDTRLRTDERHVRKEYPAPLYKLRQSPKLIRSLRLL